MNQDIINAKYLIELKGKHIDANDYSCSGEQLALLCLDAESAFGSLCWYTFRDWQTYHYGLTEMTGRICSFGDTSSFILHCKKVKQFKDGVFFGVPAAITDPKFRADPHMEDDRFEALYDALLEIRAFDGYQFEIYSGNYGDVKYFSDKYGVKILQESDFNSTS